jgi:hypothetical protein
VTFAEMQAAVYDDLNYGTAPSTNVASRVKRWLNEGYLHLLREPGLTNLRQGSLTFSSVASQEVYGLPQAFDKAPDAIVQTTNNVRLQYRSRDWYRTVDPGQTDTGNPYVWMPAGLTPVLRQPDQTAGSGVWAVSSDAADTLAQVLFQGIRLGGTEVVQFGTTLTGTTRVALGAITDYVNVRSWTLTATCAGAVTLYDAAASGNILGVIPIGQTSVQYQGIQLWPTPASALSYRVDGQFSIRPMVEDSEVPMLPVSYQDMLPVYCRMREYAKQGDGQRVNGAREEWEMWKRRLLTYVGYPADYIAVPGRLGDGRVGWNDLGGAYPADWFL